MNNVNQVFIDMAEKAIAYDKSGQLEAAIYSYLEVARTINHLIDEGRLPSSYRDAANKYFDRSSTLKEQSNLPIPCFNLHLTDEFIVANVVSAKPKTDQELNMEKAEFLISEAISNEENNSFREAQELYAQAAEFCLAQV